MTESISLKKLDKGTLIACCLAVAAAQLCITVPSPINDNMQAAFGASGSQVAWVTSAFILPTAILELNFGVLGDLFGHNASWYWAGSSSRSVNSSTPPPRNITMLWVGQALAVIATATPDEKDRAKAVSTWALSISLASALGPLSSGVLATVADFRWAFVPPVVLGLAVGVTCWYLVTGSKAPEGRTLDWPGQITIAIGLTALLWGIIEGGDRGWAARRSSARSPSPPWPWPASFSPRSGPRPRCSTWTCCGSRRSPPRPSSPWPACSGSSAPRTASPSGSAP